jgi:hypothetical protein
LPYLPNRLKLGDLPKSERTSENMPDEGEKSLPLLHNFQTNKNKLKFQKPPRGDEEELKDISPRSKKK